MAFPVGGRIAESSKARVRKGTLLSEANLRLLLEQATVGDVALRLRETPYAAVLKNVAIENMRRSELEFLLNVFILSEGVAFRHYANGGDRKLLDLWLESFDVALIKDHLQFRAEENAEQERLSPGRVLDIVSGFQLTLVDQEKLLSGSSLRDILASVRKDSLRAALSEAVPPGFDSVFAERGAESRGVFRKTMFALGMILDRSHFDSLYAAAAALGGEEGRMMRVLVGTRVDLLNLYWIYRARRFFGMPPEEALTLILKARYRVNFELLTKAAFAPPEAFASVLEGTPYAAVFESGTPRSGAALNGGAASNEGGASYGDAALREFAVERRLYGLLQAAAGRVFMSGASGFQNVAAYLMLREFEVRDIIAVVEMVRYGLDKSRAGLLLIRSLGKGD
jgi:V/A-type H+-transporting ATPase subunit C